MDLNEKWVGEIDPKSLERVKRSREREALRDARGYEWFSSNTGGVEFKPFQYDKERAVNNYIKGSGIDTNKISDGFHTFGELYENRIELFIAFCKLYISHITDNGNIGNSRKVWRSKRHSDGELAFGGGWFVLGLFKEKGKQITYHLPEEYWERCDFAQELEKAPEFDGHTSQDVIERLKTL